MQPEAQIKIIADKVEKLIAATPAHFLVEVRIKPTNNVKVFIDSDNGIVLSELIDYNRKLYKELEESGLFPDGDFSLEVSSPGLDEPLKNQRQYHKNIGRFVEVVMKDSSKKEGRLTGISPEGLVLETETGKGRKKEIKQETLLFSDIKQTKIQVKF